MARLDDPQRNEAALRAWLLDEALDFRRTHVEILLDPEHPDWAEYAWRECSKAVDVLASGQPYQFARWKLPDDHPQRVVGSIHDDLVLDEHNVLRVVS
jgi:hypothetical protein